MTYTIRYARFAAIYAGLSIALPIGRFILEAVTGETFDSAALGFIPMFIAAMTEGQSFARAQGRRPDKGEAWRIALRLTGLGIMISLILLTVYAALVGLDWSGIPAPGPDDWSLFSTILGVAVVLAALILLVSARMFLSLGARSEVKAIQKRSGQDRHR